jgi:VanZ family protein
MKITPDKWKHFWVGIAIGAVLQASFSYLLNTQIGLSTWLAFILSVVIAYGFELYSKFTGRGHYEVLDALAAVIGAIIGIAAVVGIGFL